MISVPMLAVADVKNSAAWYCELLGAKHDHDSDEFDQILNKDREIILMLHHRHVDEHGGLNPRRGSKPGRGIVIWILVPKLAPVYKRARAVGKVEVVVDKHLNPRAGWLEFSVRDPDGYTVAIAEASWL